MSVPPEDDMDFLCTNGASQANPIEVPHTPVCEEYALPRDLEELDLRMEVAILSLGGLHTDELCVWACACFLVDGSLP